VFDVLKEKWGKIDFVVHAIAFADKDQLEGRYIETTADNFSKSMADLLLLADRDRAARREADDRRRLDHHADLLRRREVDAELQRHGRSQGGARGQRALSRRDLGQKAIRVNAISAGPIKTLAFAGIADSPLPPEVERGNAPLAP